MRSGLADFRTTVMQRIRHLNTSTTGELWTQSLHGFAHEINSILSESPTTTFDGSAKRVVSELFAWIAGSETAPRFSGDHITAEHVEACRSHFPGSRGISDFGVRLVTLLSLSSLLHENPSLDLSNPQGLLNAVYCWVNGMIWNSNHAIEKSRIENQLEYCVHFAKHDFLYQEMTADDQYDFNFLSNVWTSSLPMDKLIPLFLAVKRDDAARGVQPHTDALLLKKMKPQQVLEVLTDIDVNLSIGERSSYLRSLDVFQFENLLSLLLGVPREQLRPIWNQNVDNKYEFVSKILESRKQIIHCARITEEQRQNFLSQTSALQKTLLIGVLSNVTVEQRTAFLGSITSEQLRAFWEGLPAGELNKKQEFWGMLSLEQKLTLFRNNMDNETRQAFVLQIPPGDRQPFLMILMQELVAIQQELQAQQPSLQEAMARKLPEFLAQLNAAPLAEGLNGSDIMHLINHYQVRMPQGPHDYMDQVSEGIEPIDIRSAPSQMINDVKVNIINSDLRKYLEAEGRLPSGQTVADISYRMLTQILSQDDPALVDQDGNDLYEEGRDFQTLIEHIPIPNPEFEISALSEGTRQEISSLEDEIKAAVAGLSMDEKAKIKADHSDFLEETMRDGDLQMYLTVNSNAYDRSVLVDLLVALKTQNKTDFISACVKIHTILGSLEQAKNGFISTFSHLFVTHYFPSAGCKGKYYHYLLRCGQVH